MSKIRLVSRDHAPRQRAELLQVLREIFRTLYPQLEFDFDGHDGADDPGGDKPGGLRTLQLPK